MQNLKAFVVFLVALWLAESKKKIYHEKMPNGQYIVAASMDLAKNKTALRNELGKHFHLPPHSQGRRNLDHENVNYDVYTQTNQELDIGRSDDKDILLRLKDYCLQKVEGTASENKLEKFKRGKCSPVIIVPGILATSLILQITDCEALKNYDGGSIFQSCGWTSCSMLSIDRPDDQYLLWVGIQVTFKVTGGHSKCFGNLFGLLYDNKSKSDDFGSRYSKAAGIKSTWFGNTDKSKAYSRCGANAIRDLSGHASLLSIMGSQCALRDYGRLIDMLQAMGYQSGLTMQPLPYDFRYGILASETPLLLPQSINNLYYTTGKKVVVVAHSLGTLHTLSGLAFHVSAQMKKKMVRHYIPITPPWFGTVSAIRNMLYGDPSYFTKAILNTGINKYGQMKFTQVSGSTFDLFLRDAFQTYRNESWMQQILKRIQYQKQPRKYIPVGNNSDLQNGQQDYPMNWFPSKYQKCFDDFFKADPYCQTGLIDFANEPIFQIKGTKYYGTEQSMTKLITDNLDAGNASQAISLWAQTKVPDKSLRSIPAPGVNTSMIFTTLYDTQIYYKYLERPFDKYQNDQNSFIQPVQIKNSPGDISVPSFSALLFVAKWIHNQTNGNNTVNVIEYCANYKGKSKHYSTISCQCLKNPFKNQLDCTHPCIIGDKNILAFVLGTLTNGNKGYPDEKLQDAVYFSERDIVSRMTNCNNLQPNSYIVPTNK